MSMTDPIADMLTRIRNAIMARQESVDMPYSMMKFSIAKLLKEEGYLKNYKIYTDEARKKFIKVYLNYDEHNRSVITGLRRVSKPGRRVYVKAEDLGKRRGKARYRRSVHLSRPHDRQRGIGNPRRWRTSLSHLVR